MRTKSFFTVAAFLLLTVGARGAEATNVVTDYNSKTALPGVRVTLTPINPKGAAVILVLEQASFS
jgi:hypothetical protein